MIPQMNNEQFALWIASIKFTNSSDVIRIADKYYEWLESKKPQQAELKHYINGVELNKNKIDERTTT
jgi:hypothetical protein